MTEKNSLFACHETEMIHLNLENPYISKGRYKDPDNFCDREKWRYLFGGRLAFITDLWYTFFGKKGGQHV